MNSFNFLGQNQRKVSFVGPYGKLYLFVCWETVKALSLILSLTHILDLMIVIVSAASGDYF